MPTATLSRKKFHVKKGDFAKVIAGNYKGETGRVLRVLPAKDQVILEGVRKIKKHSGKTKEHPEGGIIEKDGPIHVSNVKKVEAPAAPAPEEKKAAAKKPRKSTKKDA